MKTANQHQQSARVIAFYLPQFHPIPENDKFWGAGFTEWTNVAKAKPLFRGHYQPRIPADLGFYDLRLPEVREQQAKMAKDAGIEGFCYWHYWFGNGKRLLERPFNEVLQTGKPDFPFCLCWANHHWTTKTWEKRKGLGVAKTSMIAEQTYPGEADYRAHFDFCLKAFKDHRYITVDGKPLFAIFDPYHFRDIQRFMELWRTWAIEAGLTGIQFVALSNSTSTIRQKEDGTIERVMPNLQSSASVYNALFSIGFDAVCSFGKQRAEMYYEGKLRNLTRKLLRKIIPSALPVQCIDYPKAMRHIYAPEDAWENVYPTLLPQWDRSPRTSKDEGIYVNSTPENFAKHVKDALDLIRNKRAEHRILFLRSWNEWGEGNYIEPDLRYGHGYLDVLSDCIKSDYQTSEESE